MRYAKIRDLQIAALIDNQVCGFQVTMDDLRVVERVIECVTELTHPSSYLIWLEDPSLFLSSQVR